jgi:regulator of protease activity HflC (stomatin/prohibitin superfamily)
MNIAILVQGFSSLLWLAAVVFLVVMIVMASRGRPIHRGGIILAGFGAAAVIFTVVSSGLVFINPQERGVVISALSPTGYRSEALQPGLRWIIPFAENVITYPISKQTYTMSIAQSEGQIQGDDSIAARTLDGQEIYVDASVIYAIDPDKVVQVHIAWQNRYGDDLVRAQSRGIIRDAVSQYGVQDVVSAKRFEMVNKIREDMGTKLSENGLMLVDFVLRNISFTQEYAASIEQKQIAEQQAQQAKLVVESKKQEAEQARQAAQGQADARVIEAKADAESRVINAKAEAEARLIQADAEAQSLEKISKALANKPELLQYQYITKLGPNVQVMLLPSDSPFILPLPGTSGTTTVTPTPTNP